MIHAKITPAEQADRLAIRELDGAWLFAERNLYVNWIQTRTSHPYPPLNPTRKEHSRCPT
jgi:hypothetical protein